MPASTPPIHSSPRSAASNEFALDPGSLVLGPEVGTVVLIPTHNRPEDLRRTVSRVLPMLNAGAQLVIVDDASTDDDQLRLLDRLEQEHAYVSVVRLPVQSGCTRARRVVLEELSCDYVVMLDDDSHFVNVPADLAEVIARRFEEEPELAVQAFPVYVRSAEDRFAEEFRPVADRQIVSWFVNCGCAMRTSAYRAVGGYRPEFASPYGEELDLSLRMIEAGWIIRKFAQPEVRHYRSNISRNSEQNVRGWSLNYLRLAWWYHPIWFALLFSTFHIGRQLVHELRKCRRCTGTLRGLIDFARECRSGVQRQPLSGRTLKVAYGLRQRDVRHPDGVAALSERSWLSILGDILSRRLWK